MKKAVCLLSGGIDSTTTAAIAKAEGWEILALTVDYGQRHRREIKAAGRVASALKIAEHIHLELDLRAWGGSALTSENIAVPVGQELGSCPRRIPITYVPARNMILLSLAVSYAEAKQAQRVYFGANSRDYSGYPDCRPEFVQAFTKAATLGTRTGVEGRPIEILAPLQKLTKAEIIRRGIELGVDYSLTWSCYERKEEACGKCDSCRIRLAAFAELGMEDPISYENK
ncbi:MAG: 7-cyano-7-deazaguanine synthase QueC [Armatimonadetes bacterium]|nr:7-cyano-7-deazaguanine synthase QueC [Armatimonadota bacterium]NIM23682.1 7-cyano-7-deazaguanine synthase QueC [Armatimonadota bacterium]NIM67553.1 7-cyano-7-deazaguanine synthase QueC [Armatimonadota bacterium]NIM76070.1 7-cyano-7-deazaguanine synthase QueC [Armatimonadota bacterium]NIN05740.1 7-cyano-7-deazaguanine synthase QueC [Armatimonadota bacterium]